MDKRINIIEEIVRNYYSLIKNEFDVYKILIYGSYAKGYSNINSDIDVAIILNTDFKKNRINVSKRLFELASQIDIRIEPKCFLKKEVERAEPASILSDIIKTGLDININ